MDPYSNRPMYPQQNPGVVPPGAYPPQGKYPPPGTVPPPSTIETMPVTYPSNEPIISVNPFWGYAICICRRSNGRISYMSKSFN